MADVIVTFDPTATPKFIFKPDTIPVTAKKETIHWIQAPGSHFSFAALALDHSNPFSNVIVQATTITADDDNHRKEEHKYSILVKANNEYYNSKDDPRTRTGGPIIRNN